jgi:DNA ligase (NAD+)
LAGSTVKRATLHNEEEIRRLDVQVGDTVALRKAGDVIPEIFDVFKELRPKDAKEFFMPTVCPECGSRLEKEMVGKESSAAWYCKNADCPAKHLEGLIHFVSKKGMNIEGLGEKIIAQFREIGLVSDYASIFHLKKEDIEGLEGFGEKSAENILLAIEKSRHVAFHQFLFSLGIRHVGETTAKDIAKFFKTFSALRVSSYEQLSSVEGVGEKVAESVISYFKDSENTKTLERLLKEVSLEETEESAGTKLEGLTFVITGSLPNLSRDEAKNLIESNGGKVTGSVSKKTDYLLAGNGGGSKREDAIQFGIKIIDEEALKNML